MRIVKLAWSESRKNKLVNFYALEPSAGGQVEVISMPFSFSSSEEARKVINGERAKAGKQPYKGSILNVCLDMSSGLLYLPNAEDPVDVFNDPNLSLMVNAVKKTIVRFTGPLPFGPLVKGDPLDTIRIRRISDFRYVSDYLIQQIGGDEDEIKKHLDTPVIEANVSKMPSVSEALPQFRDNPNLKGVYVPLQAGPIEFRVKETAGENSREILLYSQKPPFILINTSAAAKTSEADKDRIITTYYKEYLVSSGKQQAGLAETPATRQLKHLMYIGWSFKELCMFALKPEFVRDFGDLLGQASSIYNAAKLLKADGYPDPARFPYYYSFQISDKFPLRFQPQSSGKPYDTTGQPEIFQIAHFDPKASYIVIKTPLWLSEDVCRKVLGAQGIFFCSQYSPAENVIKTDDSPRALKNASPDSLKVIHEDVLSSGATLPEGKPGIPFKSRPEVEAYFEKKHVSDYPQAADIVRKMCAKVSTQEKEIKFDDLEVVVGPWEKAMGILGGYTDKRKIEEEHMKVPIEPFPGVRVYPPAILLDSSSAPSVGDRLTAIVHEYTHHINNQLWIKSPRQKLPGSEGHARADMLEYLSGPDERLAHISHFKCMMALGMSKEEMLRKSIDGKVTAQNLVLARKYMELIDQAAREVEQEEKEEKQLKTMQKALQESVKGTPQDQESSDEMFDPESFNYQQKP
jgi:hypothetical protein